MLMASATSVMSSRAHRLSHASAMVENTANRCEKVTFSDHFEQHMQRKAGSVTLYMWDDDDKFGIGPNVFFPFSPGKKS